MSREIDVAIVDYGMGNIFSVMRACEAAGMSPRIADAGGALRGADLVILPGVGAFSDAMATLRSRGLATALREWADAGSPLWGICLGLQLLFDVSFEMGEHEGLGILAGTVERLPQISEAGRLRPKVPRVGWAPIHARAPDSWIGTPLADLESTAWMYFVHSYFAKPKADVTVAWSSNGISDYCAAIQSESVFGTQFHPERSGPAGLSIYRAVARQIRNAHQSS